MTMKGTKGTESRKIYIFIFALFLIFAIPTYSHGQETSECTDVFAIYRINPKIKSQLGWGRVFKNQKMDKYVRIEYMNEKELKKLKNCLYKEGFKIIKYKCSKVDMIIKIKEIKEIKEVE